MSTLYTLMEAALSDQQKKYPHGASSQEALGQTKGYSPLATSVIDVLNHVALNMVNLNALEEFIERIITFLIKQGQSSFRAAQTSDNGGSFKVLLHSKMYIENSLCCHMNYRMNSAYYSMNSVYYHMNSVYYRMNSVYYCMNSAYYHMNSVYYRMNSACHPLKYPLYCSSHLPLCSTWACCWRCCATASKGSLL